jgi:hypothetical protein
VADHVYEVVGSLDERCPDDGGVELLDVRHGQDRSCGGSRHRSSPPDGWDVCVPTLGP